jgi:hypothetical protein
LLSKGGGGLAYTAGRGGFVESLYKEAKAVMAPIRKGLVRIFTNGK